jgi:hypothetical protein
VGKFNGFIGISLGVRGWWSLKSSESHTHKSGNLRRKEGRKEGVKEGGVEKESEKIVADEGNNRHRFVVVQQTKPPLKPISPISTISLHPPKNAPSSSSFPPP